MPEGAGWRDAFGTYGQGIDDARAAGSLGFYGRLLAQATLPHRDPKTASFERTNGALTLAIVAPPHIGVPYGSIPRLLLAWMTSEAIRTRSRELVLGETLNSFLRQLDLTATGGKWGTIGRLRRQMRRLFSSAVSVHYAPGASGRHESLEVTTVVERAQLWWDPVHLESAESWRSSVLLSTAFYRDVIDRPIPVDLAALRALRRSPLALDLYTWLTYRMSYLQSPVTVPWEGLHGQFGSEYRQLRQFRPEVRRALQSVARVYPFADVALQAEGLRLRPSPTHVRRRR